MIYADSYIDKLLQAASYVRQLPFSQLKLDQEAFHKADQKMFNDSE